MPKGFPMTKECPMTNAQIRKGATSGFGALRFVIRHSFDIWLSSFVIGAPALLMALALSASFARAADEPAKKTFFLPKSPTAAAYVLARLSNKELIEAPRSEFVYVALLQRKGLERRFRFEAVEGLARIRN